MTGVYPIEANEGRARGSADHPLEGLHNLSRLKNWPQYCRAKCNRCMQSCRNGPEPVAARPAEGHGGLHGSGRDARNGKQRHGWMDPPCPGSCRTCCNGHRAWNVRDPVCLCACWHCRRLSDACVGDRRRPESHVSRQLTGSLVLTLYRALLEPEQDCIYILYRLHSFHSQLPVSSRASLANNQV